MTAAIPNNNDTLNQDAASNILDKSDPSYFNYEFEQLSISDNNAIDNIVQEYPDDSNNIQEHNDHSSSINDSTITYTDSTVILKPDDINDTSALNSSIPPSISSNNTNTTINSNNNNSPLTSSPVGTPTLIASNLQYSPSVRPNRSPSFQPNPYPPQQQHPQFNNGVPHPQQFSNSMGPPQMRAPNPNYFNNNNLSRQPTGYYSERPIPQQMLYRPQQQMMSPQMQFNPNIRPMGPPPPPSHNYYQGYPQQPMRPMMPPPNNNFIPPSQPVQDATYLSDSSLSAASSAGRKPKTSQFPPFTKENLEIFRNNAKNSPDPKTSLDLAKFLVEGANQLNMEGQDPKKLKKARDAMFDEAQKIVKKLANHTGMGKQGYPDAQFFLADCYGTGGMGLQMEPDKAFQLYVQGSKQNHPGCTFRAAVCYEVGAGTKKDKNHAMQFYRKAANLGDQTAMYKLGMILLKGLLSQPKNPREGISWLKRAAQQADEDHPHALHELGLCFEKEGIPSVIPDLNYSRELFTQAAQYGYAPSQFKLGLAYENGFLNCPIDPRRSIAWYSKAAEQGDVEAEFALSGWYLTGAEGVLPQSDKEAYLWARKAADRGSAKAEYAVGYYTETGTGVPQNLEEAKRWYMRAAAQNYRKAMQRLTELKYGGARPQQRRKHTRDGNNTSSNSKDSECTIM